MTKNSKKKIIISTIIYTTILLLTGLACAADYRKRTFSKIDFLYSSNQFQQPLITSTSVSLRAQSQKWSGAHKWIFSSPEEDKVAYSDTGELALPKGFLLPNTQYSVQLRSSKKFWEYFSSSNTLNFKTPTVSVAALGTSITLGAGDEEGVRSISNESLEFYLGGATRGKVAYASCYLNNRFDPAIIFNYGLSAVSIVDPAFQDQINLVLGEAQSIDFAYITIGANDVRSPYLTSKDQYKKKMNDIVSQFNEKGITVILEKPGYISTDGGIWLTKDVDLLKEYAEVVDSFSGRAGVVVNAADNFAYFKEHDDLLADGVHPNKLGHKYLGKEMAQTIVSAYNSLHYNSI